MEVRRLSPVWMLCVAQLAVTTLAMMVAWGLSGSSAALAALFGGMVALVPALFFAVRVGAGRRSSQPKAVLRSFYQAELGKLLLTALLFYIGARFFGRYFAPLMLTCVACLAMNWLLLAVTKRTDN